MEKKIKTENYTKLITKQNLKGALDFAFNDLETADYNNDTSPIKNLKQSKKRMRMKKMTYKL